jgi:hypothetical protein
MRRPPYAPRVDRAQHRCSNDAQKEHPTKPERCGEDVDGDVEVVERGHSAPIGSVRGTVELAISGAR